MYDLLARIKTTLISRATRSRITFDVVVYCSNDEAFLC